MSPWSIEDLLTELRRYYRERYPDSTFEIQRSLNHLHSEVSEVWEDVRAGRELNEIWKEKDERGTKYKGIPIELADVILVALGIAARGNIDITKALRLKMGNNWARADKKGEV